MCKVIASVHRSPKRFLKIFSEWTGRDSDLIDTAKIRPMLLVRAGDIYLLRAETPLEFFLCGPSRSGFTRGNPARRSAVGDFYGEVARQPFGVSLLLVPIGA